MSTRALELTEEPYDGPVAVGLVHALLADLNDRYAEWADEAGRDDHQAQEDAAYLAEVVAADLIRPHGAFVLAWVDGEPVGCGALRPSGQPGLAEIKRMYSVPAARRTGVGRAVLQRLEALAVELGYRSVRLETGTGQPEAIALYESNGWQRIEPFGRFADHPTSVCLAKDLTEP